MNRGPTEPARLPPAGLDGLQAAWSRLVSVPCADGPRTFHVLDSQPDANPDVPVVLCVHGNPSWSYLWRRLFDAETDCRIIALDHLDMGFSERTGTRRVLADRVADLSALTATLGITGRVVTVAHDWGGPISLGWALAHRDQLEGLVLLNTAVHQPAGSPAPQVIRAARRPALLPRVTRSTTAFIDGALAMSRPRLPKAIREAFLAPYATSQRRAAIQTFVEDIPLEDTHPTGPVLDGIADGLGDLGDVPALLLWGAKDPVFSDLYLHDLEQRLPHADVHRYPDAGHFVSEDAPAVDAIVAWLPRAFAGTPDPQVHRSAPDGRSTLLDALRDPANADNVAVRELTEDNAVIDFGALSSRVEQTARALRLAGVSSGDRVAIMIPPGIELAAAVYGAWRAGAVSVLIDGALSPPQMSAALRSANPKWLVGIPRALAAARALRWPGTLIAAGELPTAQARIFGNPAVLPELASRSQEPIGDDPPAAAPAAVVFTSGSTGPSKGVCYSHAQLAEQRDAIMKHYEITSSDRLVAAFAPFALYGPMMGISSAVPDMDVSAPSTLDAQGLADAVRAISATMVFASPAALENIVRTSDTLADSNRSALADVRLLLSAGAPVRDSLLRAMGEVLPNAIAHTPYGMTECLPVASISLPEIEQAGAGDGVCVGRPLQSVDLQLLPLAPGSDLAEISVRAPHMRAKYDRLWHTTHAASRPDESWHATGDVGSLDDEGRLWVAGRVAHVIWTSSGPVGPVGLEKAVERLDGIYSAAVVGVGPPGVQQVVVVVQRESPKGESGLADLALIDAVRELADVDVAAVLETPKLPVDRRHNSKIDRTQVAAWVSEALSGGPLGDL